MRLLHELQTLARYRRPSVVRGNRIATSVVLGHEIECVTPLVGQPGPHVPRRNAEYNTLSARPAPVRNFPVPPSYLRRKTVWACAGRRLNERTTGT